MNKITIDFGGNKETFMKALLEYAKRNKIFEHSIEIQGNNAIFNDVSSIDIFHLGMYFERELNKENISEDKYIVVEWPESQDFIGRPDVYLINDDNGYRDFGSSAYFVPENIYNLVMNNKDKV